MGLAERQNHVAENESPISSAKYNEEVDNLYYFLNRVMSSFQGTEPPPDTFANTFWLDTNVFPAVMRHHDGTSWVWSGVYAGSVPPWNPMNGALFINMEHWAMSVYDAEVGAWMNVLDKLSDELVELLEQAENHAASAFASKVIAESCRDICVTSRDLAERWASESVNVVVQNGKYSAKHWATKAEDLTGTAQGVFEVSGGENRSIDPRILNMRSEKIENLADPVAAQDAVTKYYLEETFKTGVVDVQAPPATGVPNGHMLSVKSGVVQWGEPPNSLPDISAPADNNKVLTVVSGVAAWGQVAGVPPGVVAPYAGNVTPAGWLPCDGALVSRHTYSALFGAIGETYGAGNGSTTFNVPDYRGEFLRGLDEGRGLDAGRTLGSVQSGQNMEHGHTGNAVMDGSHVHATTVSSSGGHNHSGTTDDGGAHGHGGETSLTGAHSHSYWPTQVAHTFGTIGAGNERGNYPTGENYTSTDGNHSHTITIYSVGNHKHTFSTNSVSAHQHTVSVASGGAHTHTLSINASGGAEARPRNVAVKYIIKT